MSYTLTAGTGVVPCEPGRTVLEAFLRNGNWMPNSCNQGTCGTCKIKVLDGELDHRNSPEETLTPDELADGFVLACQATPRGDVVFETPATEESAGTHVLRDVVATVTEVRDIAADTRKVLLTADEPLEFSAGQYVEVTVPGTEIRRQYSLANPPSEAKQLELHIRRQPGGIASEWVFERIDVGERVAVTGPYGDFTFDPEAPARSSCSAVGRASPRSRPSSGRRSPSPPTGRSSSTTGSVPARTCTTPTSSANWRPAIPASATSPA